MYLRALAAVRDCVQMLVPTYLSQADCDAAQAELAHVPVADIMRDLKQYRDDARYIMPELRPVLAKHGF